MSSNSILPMIVEPKEFHQWQQDNASSSVLIIDLSSEGNYVNGHVNGAIYLPFKTLLMPVPPAAAKLPTIEHLEMVFSALGLTPDTHVVTYDDEGGGWAGRLIWTLDAIGHHKYSYINGGLHAWVADGLPLQTDINRPTPSQYKIDAITDARATVEFITAHLNQDHFQVWDARSPREFSGEDARSARAGHMPGAINAEWTDLMDKENGLRIRSDAKEYLANLGINENQTIVTHCQSHHRSAFTYLVGKSLGFDIRAYDGSWSEWGNLENTPIES
ncbi:sulfurtransferase [Sessilibacter sp. MAH2]